MSVLISSNLTVRQTALDDANRARLLVDNVFQLGTITASSEVGANSGWLENAVSGETFDYWQPSELPAWLSVTLSESQEVDAVLVAVHSTITYVTQYKNDAGTWVDLHESVATPTGNVDMVIFTPVTASEFRIYITASGETPTFLGVLMLGKSIQFPKKFYGGHRPINLNRTVDLTKNITEGGFVSGVYHMRTGAESSVTIDNMSPGWIRNNIETLNKQLETRPFGFAWRPGSQPDDVAYCWLTDTIRAENTGPRDLMKLEFNFNAHIGGAKAFFLQTTTVSSLLYSIEAGESAETTMSLDTAGGDNTLREQPEGFGDESTDTSISLVSGSLRPIPEGFGDESAESDGVTITAGSLRPVPEGYGDEEAEIAGPTITAGTLVADLIRYTNGDPETAETAGPTLVSGELS